MMTSTLLATTSHVLAVAPQNVTVSTLGESFDAGGPLMWAILLCSIIVVGLAIERYYTLRRGNVLPAAIGRLVEQVRAGEIDAARDAAGQLKVGAARALLAGIDRRGLPLHDVERGMEDQLHKESARMRANVRGISVIAAIAPLLGLLGTVLGIAEAFGTVAETGMGKAEHLAAGINVALYTTIFGLGVAIPATLVAAHLGARVRGRMMDVAEALLPAVQPLALDPRKQGPEGQEHAA